MGKTKISWTDETSNPLIALRWDNRQRGWACVRVSDGCKNCYAATLNEARRWNKGTGLDYTVPNLEKVEIRIDEKELQRWGTMRKPRRVFVCSMTDMFGEFVPDGLIERLLSHMASHEHITFQVLTKRAERARAIFGGWFKSPPKNIWLGVSVENQKAADERIPLLAQVPAAVRFLSCEPLLEPIDSLFAYGMNQHYFAKSIHWVIAGGESGPNFRPMELDWARSIRDQCVAAQVPFWYKQGSAYRPQADALLDGVQWHQFPEVR